MATELTPEQEELLANPKYKGIARSWTPSDLALAYDLYNRIFNTNKKDSGCPSCRRQVIFALQQEYQKALKLKDDK